MILIVFLLSYFSFGLFILSKLSIKFSLLEKIVFSLIISISLIASSIALLGQVVSTNAYFLLLATGAVGATQYKELVRLGKQLIFLIKNNKLAVLFCVVSIAILSSTMIFSYKNSSGDLVLQELHDSIWHIGLMENLSESIPPLHPSTATITLNNYHYFYDLFLVSLDKFSYISNFIIYFQFSVLLLAGLLVSSAYIVGKKLHSKLAGIFLVGFTTFAGSLAYLIPVFNPGQIWHESSFWVSQTLVMMVNPQVIYTIAVSYLVITLFSKLMQTKPNSQTYIHLHGLVILLSATSIGFKSYAWVILSFMYACYLLIELITFKSIKTILVGLVYLFVSAPMVWLITKFAGNSFFYEPLWYTNTMVESPDRVNYLEWKFLQDHYLFKKNWPRLILLEAKKLFVFYFGNLGVRGIFVALPLLLLQKKYRKLSFWKIPIVVLSGFLFSSIFPLLFLQRGTVWNSIQFWYYALIFANILAVILLAELLRKKSKLVVGIIAVILFAIAIPTSVKTISDKYKDPFVFEAEKISYLESLSPEKSILICSESTGLYKSLLVKVLSPANVYLSNPSQLQLVGSDMTIAENYEKIIAQRDPIELRKIAEANNVIAFICTDSDLTKALSEKLNKPITTIEDMDIISF